MNTLRTAAFAAALLVSGAAFQSAAAMSAVGFSGLTSSDASVAQAAFVLDESLAASRLQAETAAASYFGFDALITLGALALSGGVLAGLAAAAARRNAREASSGEPAWRQTVFRALQADLTAFTETYRRAA